MLSSVHTASTLPSNAEWPQSAPARGDEPMLEQIRWAMLRSIEKIELTPTKRMKLERRILLAKTVTDLWFLRTDIWHVIGLALGEREANLTLHDLSAMFDGILPAAWTR